MNNEPKRPMRTVPKQNNSGASPSGNKNRTAYPNGTHTRSDVPRPQSASHPQNTSQRPNASQRPQNTSQRTNNSAARNVSSGTRRRSASGAPAPRPRTSSASHKKRTINPTPFIIAAIVLIIVIIVVAKCSADPSSAKVSAGTVSDTAVNTAVPDETTLPPVKASPASAATELGDGIYSQYAILIEASDGKVIAEKNADMTAYPASLTKIMTAVVTLENITDLEATYTLEDDMFDYIYSQSAATAGYEAGETVRIIDLLNAMLIPSGAEASIALARYVAGSESEFAVMMNAKAKELGMNGTHYVNCTGLHDINHYTTAADMAKLLKYALSNATFKNIVSTQVYYAPATNIHPDGLTFTHTMFKAFTAAGYDIGDVMGGKTGYTDLAGMCLASYEVKGGKTYICVTMGAGDGTNSTAWHVMDADTIYKSFT
ncbi:MAG: serine hydrolase [Eubacteriales bacterium]